MRVFFKTFATSLLSMGDHYENLVAIMSKLENILKLCMPADILFNFTSSAHQKIVLKGNQLINLKVEIDLRF